MFCAGWIKKKIEKNNNIKLTKIYLKKKTILNDKNKKKKTMSTNHDVKPLNSPKSFNQKQ
jgi:hypothetical protein